MAIDPICGMNVDEKKAEKKELVVNAEKNTYFCSKQCMEKYLKKEKRLNFFQHFAVLSLTFKAL